jgi:hypothetical protein
MADFPLLAASRWAEDDASAAANYKTTITASGTINTKGSWTQMVASAPFDVDSILLTFEGPGTGQHAEMVDIGVGAGGSETVVVSNIFLQTFTANLFYGWVYIPFHCPAGTRIAMRSQSDVASTATYWKMQMVKAGFFSGRTFQSPVTYGATTASTSGAVVTAGTSNAKGSYTQLTASTTAPIRLLMLCFGQGGVTVGPMDFGFDIAVGAGGSEVVVIPDISVWLTNTNGDILPSFLVLPVDIPAGTRLSARVKCTSNGQAPQLVVIGWA